MIQFAITAGAGVCGCLDGGGGSGIGDPTGSTRGRGAELNSASFPLTPHIAPIPVSIEQQHAPPSDAQHQCELGLTLDLARRGPPSPCSLTRAVDTSAGFCAIPHLLNVLEAGPTTRPSN